MKTLKKNFKNQLIAIFILIIPIWSIAGTNSTIKKQSKKYLNSYEYYIQSYGVNDTAIALIDLYFDKRQHSANAQISMFVLSGALFPIYPPLGFGMLCISTPLLINGLIIKAKYSNSQLDKSLYRLNNNIPLKRSIAKKLNKKIEYNNMDKEYLGEVISIEE